MQNRGHHRQLSCLPALGGTPSVSICDQHQNHPGGQVRRSHPVRRCPSGQPFRIKHIRRTGSFWLLPASARVSRICLSLRGCVPFRYKCSKTFYQLSSVKCAVLLLADGVQRS